MDDQIKDRVSMLELKMENQKNTQIEERLREVEVFLGQQKLINKIVSATFTIAIAALMTAIVELVLLNI